MWFDSVFFSFFLFGHITVFRVSIALPCTPITPISIDTVLKVLKLLPLESLSTILEYRFALQQQQRSRKMSYFMFSLGPNSTILGPRCSVEKSAYVTWMLDNNLLICRILYIVYHFKQFVFNQNNKYWVILWVSPYELMQGCPPEWRTNLQREATTGYSKRDQSRNTIIPDRRILCTPLSKFLDPPLIVILGRRLIKPTLHPALRIIFHGHQIVQRDQLHAKYFVQKINPV